MDAICLIAGLICGEKESSLHATETRLFLRCTGLAPACIRDVSGAKAHDALPATSPINFVAFPTHLMKQFYRL